MHPHVAQARPVRSAIMLLVGAMLFVTALARPAQAAELPGVITPDSVVISTVTDADELWVSTLARIDAEWTLPADAHGGDTFSMQLPAEFSRYGGAFDLTRTSGGPALGRCIVSTGSSPVLTCTLSDVVDELDAVTGSLFFQVQVDQSTDETSVDFVIDGQVVPVDVPGSGGIGPQPPLEVTTPQKVGWQDAHDKLLWEIQVPGKDIALVPSVTIVDTMGPGQHGISPDPQVRTESGGVTTHLPASAITTTWNADRTGFTATLSGPFDANAVYIVRYWSEPDEAAVSGDLFTNSATVNGVDTHVGVRWRVSGGGSGEGDGRVWFTLVKRMDGDVTVPAGTSFRVQYSYGTPEVVKEMTVVPGGAPVASARFPRGTVVTIEEIDLPAIDGITWGTPRLAGPGVTALGAGRYRLTATSSEPAALTLTNVATTTPATVPTTTPPTEPTMQPAIDALTVVEPQVAQPQATLAATGSDLGPELPWLGALLTFTGGAIVLNARARRH